MKEMLQGTIESMGSGRRIQEGRGDLCVMGFGELPIPGGLVCLEGRRTSPMEDMSPLFPAWFLAFCAVKYAKVYRDHLILLFVVFSSTSTSQEYHWGDVGLITTHLSLVSRSFVPIAESTLA
jgi:hypothetical protein